MGDWRRVIHNGNQIVSVEHRADEYQLGAAAYTNANLPSIHAGKDWFIQDVSVFDDAEGVVPWDALSISNPTDIPSRRAVLVDSSIRDSYSQRTKDDTKGAGGRLDTLHQKLRDSSISDSERDEMLRLERGL